MASLQPVPHRYATLDAMRGIAAVAIMFYHMNPNSVVHAGFGYLAVDLFFCLSGFVLVRAYEEALLTRMNFGEFLLRRIIRFYPMLFLGALLAIGLHGAAPGILLLLPDPTGRHLYPENHAFWSLLFELAINAVYAGLAVRLGTRWLALVALASGIILAGLIAAGEPLYAAGAEWSYLGMGVCRTVFGFTLGVILGRLGRGSESFRTPAGHPYILLIVLAVTLQFGAPGLEFANALGVFVIVPVFVWLGSRWELRNPRLTAMLGGLSYPLYCIHMPLVRAVTEPLEQFVVGLCCIALALMLDKWVDAPVQRAFKRYWSQRSTAARLAAPAS